MNLLTFRKFFRTHSGRHDLVDSDGSDNGADVLIVAGQKYLDRLVDIPAAIGRVFKDIVAGDYIVIFQNCRSIHDVWCVGTNDNGDMVRLPLTKATQNELRGVDSLTGKMAYTKIFSGIDQDRPQFYTPAQLRLETDSDGLTGGIGGFMDVQADGFQTYNGVFFMPPSDGDYTIEIIGNFYHLTLSADGDSNFWTEQHYMILYMATMRQIEVLYRNTQGVNDWEATINKDLATLDMDGVKEESIDGNEMEG